MSPTHRPLAVCSGLHPTEKSPATARPRYERANLIETQPAIEGKSNTTDTRRKSLAPTTESALTTDQRHALHRSLVAASILRDNAKRHYSMHAIIWLVPPALVFDRDS
jgi:hypothetical protein